MSAPGRDGAGIPAHERLTERLDAMKGGLSNDTYVRVYRSISWIRACDAPGLGDEFRLFALWVAFNSLYGGSDFDFITKNTQRVSDKRMFKRFLSALADRDSDGLRKVLYRNYSLFQEDLIDNRYVHYGFWIDRFQREPDEAQWARQFENDRRRMRKAFKETNLAVMMDLLFERLYVLRNQVFHGASTCGGSLNRRQLRAGVAVLGDLVPVMVGIVLQILQDSPDYDRWGNLPYPPVDRK